jgi:hypothetical protein
VASYSSDQPTLLGLLGEIAPWCEEASRREVGAGCSTLTKRCFLEERFASLVIEQMVNNERKIFFEEKEIVI